MAIQTLLAGNNKRYVERKELALGVSGRFGERALVFTIRNMSQTGFLAACNSDLVNGQPVNVDLPHVGPTAARVVWSGDGIYGFNFDAPITRSAVSAALLQGDPRDAGFTATTFDPTDTMWDTSAEAQDYEKLPLHTRAWLVIGLATLPWVAIALAFLAF